MWTGEQIPQILLLAGPEALVPANSYSTAPQLAPREESARVTIELDCLLGLP